MLFYFLFKHYNCILKIWKWYFFVSFGISRVYTEFGISSVKNISFLHKHNLKNTKSMARIKTFETKVWLKGLIVFFWDIFIVRTYHQRNKSSFRSGRFQMWNVNSSNV